MKNIVIKNYFSHIALIVLAISMFFSFAPLASAQLSYGGIQLMEWGSEVCNSNNGNVHFILNNGDELLTLYADPGIREYGDSNVEFGISQVGTYSLVPYPCIVSGSPPVTIWVTDGTYIDATTGYTILDKGLFLAGGIKPFIQSINPNA